MSAGGVYAGLLVYLDAKGNGYAFLVQPERRGIGWWQMQAGVPTMAITKDVYRPSFWAAAADVVGSLAIAATAALAFALAAALLVALFRVLARGRPPALDPEEPALASTPVGSARRSGWLIAIAAGLIAFAGALAVCLGPLDGIPHVQDSVAYLWQAKIFALGHAAVPAPPAPEFFDQGFILITDGRWFTKYPPGWPLLLVPGVLAGVPWIVNPLVAGLSVALITATTARLYGRAAAVATAMLAVTSPFFLFMSGSYMSHPAAMLAVAAALHGFVRLKTDPAPAGGASRQPAWRREGAAVAFSLLVGFALGWAFITREATAAGIAFPFAVWALADIAGALRAALRRGPGTRRVLLRRLRPYGLMVLGALPPLVILGVVDQALLGSPFRLAQELVGSYDRLGFGPGFGPEPAGHSPALGLVNGLIYWRTLAQDFLGWPPPLTFGPLLLAVAALVARPWRLARWDLFLLGGFLGLAGIYFAWWSATTIYGPRYWYEGLPFLLILSGRGVAVLGEAAARSLRAWGARLGAARLAAGFVPLLVFGPCVLYDLAQVLPGQVRAYTGYNDVTASSLQRVAAAHLDHALVFVALQPDYPRRDYGKVFFANDPLLRGPVVYVRDLGAARDRGLLGYFPDRQPYYLPLDGPPRPGVGP